VRLKWKLLKGVATYTEQQIWEAVEKKRNSSDQDAEEFTDVRRPEWEVFSNPDPSRNSRDFKLRVVDSPKSYQRVLKKVVLAERLREVQSLIGFTRIESAGITRSSATSPRTREWP